MDVSEQGGNYRYVSEIKNLVQRNCSNETSRHHFTEELRWSPIGKLEARQSQIDVARWLNVSPSVIHRLRQQFLTMGSVYRRFSQGQPRATTNIDNRFLSLCEQRNGTATPATSDPLSLQALEGWYQGQPCI
ncbi:HTH_Tnp_Tc3_2 domain-containing protein [Trichonephila clavipes]|nr:HTH_Tnp_Tc3_2 domain-containing protein [Trichonephila clavipes]